jgi:hypothetical protein
MGGCIRFLDAVGNSTARDTAHFMGMIGFDIACETARSGPRMQGYLVNDPRKQQVPISSAPTLLSLRKQ